MITQSDEQGPADFKAFFFGLDRAEHEALAQRAGYTAEYIRVHLTAPPGRRKVPKKGGIGRLFIACVELGASFSKSQLVAYFYQA
jgi:hypothetical protein